MLRNYNGNIVGITILPVASGFTLTLKLGRVSIGLGVRMAESSEQS